MYRDERGDEITAVGREAEDFRVDSFDVSYGDPQTVAVWAKRALENVRVNYRIDGGRTRTLGTILGAAAGALIGKEIDGGTRCR